MRFDSTFTDEAVLAELGKRLARLRIELSWTQARLADRAGVGKRTVERLENGESVQLVNLVRVFRALGLVERLDAFLPEVAVRPMERLGRREEPRKRASSPRSGVDGGASWVWEDER
jgi:transcriptional regulator with XRE-family HTH domain